MTARLRSRLFLLALLALTSVALGCGAPAESPPPDETAGDETAGEPTWASLEGDALATYVRDGALARIAEVEPSLDLSPLDGWAADPESAPALGDRVSEQLLNVAIADAAAGNAERAAGIIALVRLKARNRNNAFVGATLLSELARRGAADGQAQGAVEAVLGALPRNRFGGATVVFQLFQNAGQIDARVAQARGQLLSPDTATAVLFYDAILRPIVEHRDVFLAAIETVRARHEGEPEADEYAFSTVDLSSADDAQEVRVAVWDTGVAGDLFEGQLFADSEGAHGVIADPTEGQTGLTFDPGAETITEYAPFLRGIMDLRAGLTSSEAAQRVLQLIGGADTPEALDELGVNLDAIGEWAHGTHVAGILLAGLPQARVAVFRSAWAGEARLYHHRGPTDEELAAERANVEAIAAFINANQIRVVNASLGFSRDYVENQLRHESDRYTSDAQVRERAAVVHAHRSASWRQVFEACPETLFVVAAGNSNRDIVEYEDVPASFSMENLLVVGAVDRFGNWATFTNSNPERVQVFDHGVEVDSVIPNGDHVPLSGTSMASPNVANLAAKMIAVNAALTPAQAIAIIGSTGDAIDAPFYGSIANEARAIAAAREAAE